jgi:hypothetical protein
MTEALDHFIGFRLTRHEIDEDGDDNGVTPGEWRTATREEYEAAYQAHPLEGRSVYSSLTDPDGQFGRPVMFTEWGTKDGRTPICAGVVLYSRDDRTKTIGCHHLVYVPSGPAL